LREEEVATLAEKVGIRALEVWNGKPQIVIRNERQQLTFKLRNGTRIAAYVDSYSASGRDAKKAPLRTEIELEVIDYPVVEADKVHLDAFCSRIVKDLPVEPSVASKYRVALNDLSILN
jgi:hypothetical protein